MTERGPGDSQDHHRQQTRCGPGEAFSPAYGAFQSYLSSTLRSAPWGFASSVYPGAQARTQVSGWSPLSSFPLHSDTDQVLSSLLDLLHLPPVCNHAASPSVQASTASPQATATCPDQPLPPSSPAQDVLHPAPMVAFWRGSGHISLSA